MVALTRRRLVVFALALFGATAATVSSVVPDSLLVVADAETDDHLLEIPVDQGEEVTIAYTHSVERTPVEDVYVVDGSELRADRSVFQSFGAGLPADVERTDEGYVVEGSESHTELFVAPGEIAGHELVVAGERYDLVDASDGRVVLFITDRFVSDAFERDGSSDGRNEMPSETRRPTDSNA
ncbi:DUF1850 domain-containing protein [Natronolimnohabitans sp. A-GB9]|uniref:DUF1850 domain-containing protein n=1 Tax=Natronolimnohabitans sp. A-GB9 TaxID=3069757 RepID=UPI0027B42E3E|nr:DUF1850 domain-containing protein [Natronolimnohabitans sp. A-GB9]MDQ2051088.1 DUF1850 domain-containing protein [Natronolimnohabitans sp. A-GB9]